MRSSNPFSVHGRFVAAAATLSLCATLFAAIAPSASADALTLQTTYSLSSLLAAVPTNFSPQGLGYDTSANELLFLQQNTATIYRTDLTGTIVGSRTLSGAFSDGNGIYSVSVAADANNYYVADFGSNSFGLDLFAIGKSSGTATALSTETLGYGAYPIDVRSGLLYRTEPSTSYSYANLAQIRVSSIATPDTITRTLSLNTPGGIADFAVDEANNNLFVLSYSSAASIYRYNLTSGTLQETYNLNLDGTTAGLTFANNTLFYYDHDETNGSRLQVYNFTPGTATAPEPTTASLTLLATLPTFLVIRRRAKR